jgi:hypothetical protein
MLRSCSLALAACGILSSSTAMALPLAEMRQQTAYIAERYLQIWSSSNAAAVTGVPYMYGPTVQFYGRAYTQAQLIDEKQRAVRQWPNRRYVHRPGTMKVTCNAAQQKCAVQSIIDFNVANPSRHTQRSGSAKFELGISFTDRQPRILYEGGSLNRKRFSLIDKISL